MQKTCRQCQASFEITDEDLEYYEKVSPVFGEKKYSVPPPSHCRDCRLQRRMIWRNERSLYTRMCDLCQKKIVSLHRSEVKFPVYCIRCWWSDNWDRMKQGKEFDFSRPFFAQWAELRFAVPQIAIVNDDGIGSENCEYCQDFAFGKNCYFGVGSWHTEDSYYFGESSDYSKFLCDCSYVTKSELVYESSDSRTLYNCAFLRNSENCSDCYFGVDLKGCKDCFGCIGLRQKQYYISNNPHTEAEYKKRLSMYWNGSYEAQEKMRREFEQWVLRFPRRNMNLQGSENCEGNNLFNSKNSFGFNAYNAYNCKFYDRGDSPQYSYDVFNSGHNTWCYESMVPDNSYMALFTLWCWKDKNVLYSDNCHSCEHLFGCISLHRAKYCIFNKQYTKEEYEALVPKIIEHMRKTGEWGEFFPMQYCSYGYNETIAQEFFPLKKVEALARKCTWYETDKKDYKLQTFSIPDNIKDVPENVCQELLVCKSCKKNYKIIPQELTFYQKMVLPISRKCAACRHTERGRTRTPYKLWVRDCAKCKKSMKTAFSPDRPEIVYCEECYLKEVY